MVRSVINAENVEAGIVMILMSGIVVMLAAAIGVLTMMNIMILFLIGMGIYVVVMITVKSHRDNHNLSFILTDIILLFSLFFNRNKATNKHKFYFFRDELHLNQEITNKATKYPFIF
jgi:hypothetical protein